MVATVDVETELVVVDCFAVVVVALIVVVVPDVVVDSSQKKLPCVLTQF